jgi:hypothetical protein
MGMTPEEILATLYNWLGESAVLLPIPLGTKKPDWTGWQTTTFEQTQTPEYHARLMAALTRGGNIGVLLTNGLVSIDIDADDRVDEFVSVLNPEFSETLQSRGYRGRNIWLHLTGEYPHQVFKLKTADGKNWGEWRGGGGCQTVIFGQHPNGTPDQIIRYSCVSKRPTMQGEFDDIAWPDNLVLPWLKAKAEPPPEVGTSTITPDIHSRILAYLACVDPAIEGDGGDKQTFTVACALVNGWALTAEQAMPYMQVYSAKCEPPWRDKELEHKIIQAVKAPHEKPRGHLIGTTYIFRKSDGTKKPEGAKKPEVNLTEPKNACPYARVDWASIAGKSVGIRRGFVHQAFYPHDSILHHFVILASRLTEATKGCITGAILPSAAALLQRRVWIPWVGKSLFPNLFNILVGPAGDGKSSVIDLSENLAKACLDQNSFLNYSLSIQGLFEQYYEPADGNPDKLCIVDEGNAIIRGWVNTPIGEMIAAEMLRLYDCKGLEETYIRNKKNNDGDATRRVDQTSTSILLGGTFNVSNFQGTLVRQGMDRRFLKYVSTGPGSTIIWPPTLDTSGLRESYCKLREVKGIMAMASEAEARWESYQRQNRQLMADANPDDDALIARTRTCPTHVLKISMIFEACRAVHYGQTVVKEIGLDCLELAMAHVDQNMLASDFLDKYADAKTVSQQAEGILPVIQKEFRRWGDTVYAIRSDLTRKFCHNTGRRGALTVSDLYDKIIPQLQAQGECVLVENRGKFKVYAFPAEPNGDDNFPNSPNSSGVTDTQSSNNGVSP